jgi:hypothetical protein
MYSPPHQPDYTIETDHFNQPQQVGTPHTTVGAVPVARSNRLFNPSYQHQFHHHHHHHQRQNSFGTVASAITMSPPNRTGGMAFTENNSQNWFGTSMDSNGSSFGQSPIFAGRDLIVSPSTSASHLDGYTGSSVSGNLDDDESPQRK